MSSQPFTYPELKYMWKHRGNKNYNLKSFSSNGNIQYMVFEEPGRSYRKVLGKIITTPREGEAYHWQRLQHENLAPLLGVVSLNEKISIYMSPFIGCSLKSTVHDAEFLNNSNCFEKKKGYAEDILWGLDYLHNKSLCLMNLTDASVFICKQSNKAIISDFTCLMLSERATKDNLSVPILYQPPEINTEYFDAVTAEIWACGVLMLQMFTRHVLPAAFIGEEVHQVLTSVKELSYDILRETNRGADLDFLIVEELRAFLELFLIENPQCRVSAKDAAISPFLYSSRRSATEAYNPNFCNEQEFKKLEPSSPSFQTHWKISSASNRNKCSPFRDIYVDEAAKCRNKFKNMSNTNKFIHLNYIPNGGSSVSHSGNTPVENYHEKPIKKLEINSTKNPPTYSSENPLELLNIDVSKKTLTNIPHHIDSSKYNESFNISNFSEELLDTGNTIEDSEENFKQKMHSNYFHGILEKPNNSEEDLILCNEMEKPKYLLFSGINNCVTFDSSEIGAKDELSSKTVTGLEKAVQNINSNASGGIDDYQVSHVDHFSKILNRKSKTLIRSKSDAGIRSRTYNNSTVLQKSDPCINYFKITEAEINLDLSNPKIYSNIKVKDDTCDNAIFEGDYMDSEHNKNLANDKCQNHVEIKSQNERDHFGKSNKTLEVDLTQISSVTYCNCTDKGAEINHNLEIQQSTEDGQVSIQPSDANSVREFLGTGTIQKHISTEVRCHRNDSYGRAVSEGFKINNLAKEKMHKQESAAGSSVNFRTCNLVNDIGTNRNEVSDSTTQRSEVATKSISSNGFESVDLIELTQNESSDEFKTPKKGRRKWLWFLCPSRKSKKKKNR